MCILVKKSYFRANSSFIKFKLVSIHDVLYLQVTRLCDLTNENDTVTSVSWAERGDKVAVGTHRGFVQVS